MRGRVELLQRRVGNYPVLCWGPMCPVFPQACIILCCLYYFVLYCTSYLAWLVLGGAPPSTPSQGSRARAKLRPNWTKYLDLDNCALWGATVQFRLKMIDSNVAMHWSLSHTLALVRNMTNFMRFTWVQGFIFRLTCSHSELTKDHVLTRAYVKIFRTITRNVVNKSVWRKKDCSWLPLNKDAMNIFILTSTIRAHLSWRTRKHLHVLHVLWTYSMCSQPGW